MPLPDRNRTDPLARFSPSTGANLYGEREMRPVLSCASLCLVLALAAPLRPSGEGQAAAQTADTTASPAADTSAAQPNARARDTRVAAHYDDAPRTLTAARASSGGTRQAQAMMVVGLGAFVAGAIIGGTPGTIIMVGGAVIGLMGLYQYLQ